jgi:hypothetical protein
MDLFLEKLFLGFGMVVVRDQGIVYSMVAI